MYNNEVNEFVAEVNRNIVKRGLDYRIFINGFKLLNSMTLSPGRKEMFETHYTFMRDIDDIVDRDKNLPRPYSTETEFVSDILEYAHNPKVSVTIWQKVFKRVLELADAEEMEIESGTISMLESMLFDAKRIGKNIILPRKELDDNFYRLDTEGCIVNMLRVYDENPEKAGIIEPLGSAIRNKYNIRDFREDAILKGYINIPFEDIVDYGIKEADLMDENSDSIKSWMRSTAVDGLVLIEDYKKRIAKDSETPDALRPLTKRIIDMLYRLPASLYFEYKKMKIKKQN